MAVTLRVLDRAGNATTRTWEATVVAGGGDRETYRFDVRRVSDSTEMRVNLANGNLLLRSHDLYDPALGVTRYYNSVAPERRGAFGRGWTADSGEDVRLQARPDGAITFFAPSGYTIDFEPAPGGAFAQPRLIDL